MVSVDKNFSVIVYRPKVQYDFLSLPAGRYRYGTLVPHLIDKIGIIYS